MSIFPPTWGDSEDLILRDVYEICIWIDEATDQPGTGNSVDLRVFARYPFAGSCADVATRRQSLLSPVGDTAFQKICLHSHEAQCGGDALANFTSVNAVGAIWRPLGKSVCH